MENIIISLQFFKCTWVDGETVYSCQYFTDSFDNLPMVVHLNIYMNSPLLESHLQISGQLVRYYIPILATGKPYGKLATS